MSTEPLVKNAADEAQVKSAREKEKLGRDLELDDLRIVLQTDAGRRLLWRFLEKAKVFSTVWENSAKIHYNSGQQDFGHFIMSEIVEADQMALLKMMSESKEREKKYGTRSKNPGSSTT